MQNPSNVVIAVICGAFPNTLEKTLDAVRSVSVGRGPIPSHWLPFCPDPLSITMVGAPEHRSVQNQFPTASWRFVNNRYEAPALVSQILQSYAASGKRVLVLGFNTDIFNLAKTTWPGFQVASQHFFEDRRRVAVSSPTTFSPTGNEPPWTWTHLATLDEALTTLAQVLSEKGAVTADNPLRQTSLRPLMGKTNSKFFGSAASTNSNGMVGTLLQIGGIRRLVQLAGDPGDYFIWLKPSEAASNELENELVKKNVFPSGVPSIDSGAGAVEVQQHGGGAPGRGEDRRRSRNPSIYRSDLYSEHIQKANMGPFPIARPKVYDALEKLVSAGSKLPLSSLIEAAIDVAKKEVPASQPWPAIRHVTQNQLLRAQVVLDPDQKPLPNRWDSGRRVVHRLEVGWRRRALGEILVALFEADSITGQDAVNVCRSVWGSSGGEALAEFYDVMEYLTDVAQIVDEDNGGVFRVKRQAAKLSSMPTRMERAATELDPTESPDEMNSIIQ